MNTRFENQRVLVTGAVGALGKALVEAFASEGATVIVASRHPEKGEALARSAGNGSIAVNLDVASPESWKAAIEATESAVGPLSTLVNNAAYLVGGTIEQVPLEEWQKVFATNVFGTVLGMKFAVPSMRKLGGGSIVNIESVAGQLGAPGLVAYGSSKWAIRGLTKTAAMEFAADNIRVNSVVPGIIDTPLAYDKDTGDELVPVGRFAVPRQATSEEIAKFVVFAASRDAAFSTGNEFVADGGFLLGPVR